jgi:hypothetical protein
MAQRKVTIFITPTGKVWRSLPETERGLSARNNVKRREVFAVAFALGWNMWLRAESPR